MTAGKKKKRGAGSVSCRRSCPDFRKKKKTTSSRARAWGREKQKRKVSLNVFGHKKEKNLGKISGSVPPAPGKGRVKKGKITHKSRSAAGQSDQQKHQGGMVIGRGKGRLKVSFSSAHRLRVSHEAKEENSRR